MNVIPIRTNAGGILSLEVTPADVVDRCSKCPKTFREGDWFCEHLSQPERTIARLDATVGLSLPVDHPQHTAFMPVFLAPRG